MNKRITAVSMVGLITTCILASTAMAAPTGNVYVDGLIAQIQSLINTLTAYISSNNLPYTITLKVTCQAGYLNNYQCNRNYLQQQYQTSSCATNWVNKQYCQFGCANNACKPPTPQPVSGNCNWANYHMCNGNTLMTCTNVNGVLNWVSQVCPYKCGISNNDYACLTFGSCTSTCIECWGKSLIFNDGKISTTTSDGNVITFAVNPIGTSAYTPNTYGTVYSTNSFIVKNLDTVPHEIIFAGSDYYSSTIAECSGGSNVLYVKTMEYTIDSGATWHQMVQLNTNQPFCQRGADLGTLQSGQSFTISLRITPPSYCEGTFVLNDNTQFKLLYN